MKCFLSCGRFICEIEGPQDVINSIRRIKGYAADKPQGKISKRICIHMEDFSGRDTALAIHNWTTECIHGIENAVYTDEGGTIFSLSAGENGDVSLYLNQMRRSCLRIALQHAVMMACAESCVGVHGVTMIHGDQAIILSAPSGTGKTTLAGLLVNAYPSVVINGDFALLSLNEEDAVIFEPTPFCGSSGRCLNHRLRINRIVFLEQGAENDWQDLKAREGLARLMSNAFIPEWNQDFAGSIREKLVCIANSVSLSLFSFAPTTDAARMFHTIVTK